MIKLRNSGNGALCPKDLQDTAVSVSCQIRLMLLITQCIVNRATLLGVIYHMSRQLLVVLCRFNTMITSCEAFLLTLTGRLHADEV